MTRSAIFALLFFALILTGCGEAPPEDEVTADPASSATLAEDTATEPETADHSAHGAADDGEGLPLRTIMQQLSVDMVAVSQGIYLENLDFVERHAAEIADHPHIAASEIERIEAELGEEMALFEELDEAVHHSSEEMYLAAQAGQMDELLEAYIETQRGCVECHTQFRDRLRTDQ